MMRIAAVQYAVTTFRLDPINLIIAQNVEPTVLADYQAAGNSRILRVHRQRCSRGAIDQ